MSQFYALVSRIPPPLTKKDNLVVIVPATLASVYLSTRLYQNYQLYLGLGRGGLPYNPIGWLVSTIFTAFAVRDTTKTDLYDSDPNQESFINSEAAVKRDGLLPKRKGGSRPKTGWHAVPHRQIDQYAPKPLLPILTSAMSGIAAANPKYLVTGQSVLERRGTALFVHPSVAPSSETEKVWKKTQREIAHVHTSLDGSLHLALSPADCKLVIEQGWGERHSLAGSNVVSLVPGNFILAYAPRDEEEAQVILRLIRAAAEYMTGNRDLE